MKKRQLTLLLIFIICPVLSFSQEKKDVFKGVVTDQNHFPLDAVSVIVFNVKDTANYIYANTFANGNFEFELSRVSAEKYGVCLLSMGFQDRYLDLEQLKDTIIMHNNLLRINDATVKGKRNVKSTIGKEGGVVYNVGNTYLSDLGTSTMLLNFIPGVKADNEGNISILGIRETVDIYINNVKSEDKEKLLSYKSEDIESIEVIRKPGAKYKNADAVILIKTVKKYEGFSARVTGMGYVSDNSDYSYSPRAELTYTRNKISISGAYNFNQGSITQKKYENREIDNRIITDNWVFKNNNDEDLIQYKHWYNANLDYRIDDKNFLNIQYSGRNDAENKEKTGRQTIYSDTGNQYDYDINSNVKNVNTRNTVHLYYKGDYSENFGLQVNADYSNRYIKTDEINLWEEIGSDPFNFIQNTSYDAAVFTTEILFESKIKKSHKITYGGEYSYLKDNVKSNDINEKPTRYKLNTHFLKAILEYKVDLSDKINLSLGGNYMFSYLYDTNQRTSYNSVIPYLSLNYYDDKKDFGFSFNAKYYNWQPTASWLDDITTVYKSPFEIETGNKDLKKTIQIDIDLSFSYKNAYFGVWYLQNIDYTHPLTSIKIQNDGKPLLIYRPEQFIKPIYLSGIYGGISDKIAFWTFNLYISGGYSHAWLPGYGNELRTEKGFNLYFGIDNIFELPKGFFIYLSGYYNTKEVHIFTVMNQKYNIDLNIEKRFFNDNLRIILEGKGLISNKCDIFYTNFYGMNTVNRNKRAWARSIGLNILWRFNNHKAVRLAKENEYLNML